MDIEQSVEWDVRVMPIHRIFVVFVDEVYKVHLEDTVEVFHYFHAK